MIGGLKGLLGDLRNLQEQVLWCAPVVLDMQGIKVGITWIQELATNLGNIETCLKKNYRAIEVRSGYWGMIVEAFC